jgi:hypothetical protein
MVKLLLVILGRTFKKSQFLIFLAAHMKIAQKLDPFTLHIRADCYSRSISY